MRRRVVTASRFVVTVVVTETTAFTDMALTDTACRNAKPRAKAYRIADTGGLCLFVRPTGAKAFRYRYRLASKQDELVMGDYPAISLQEARRQRDEAAALIARGASPKNEQRAVRLRQQHANASTFAAVTVEWQGKHASRWSAKYADEVERRLKLDVLPSLGPLPVSEISAAQVLAVVNKVYDRGAVHVAFNVRMWCSAIFRYAMRTSRAASDPADALRGALVRPPVEHNPHLTRDDLPHFLADLVAFQCSPVVKMALHLVVLTFVRTIELRAAEWSEFDLDAALWRVPAERMKKRQAHDVPLSVQAVAILRELHTLTGKGRYLFPNLRRPQTYMAHTTLLDVLRRMGWADRVTVHGLRGTARTELAEMGFPEQALERQLAHAKRSRTVAAYDHARHWPARVKIMQAWADHLDALARGGDKVVPLRAKRA